MPISHDIVNLKGNSTFSNCFEWNKFLKRFSGSTKECATKDQILNHNLVNISFFKIDELGLVGKCVKHSFRIYIGCYLQFCITKKLRPVNKNLSKVHFFHILSAHVKGLKKISRICRCRPCWSTGKLSKMGTQQLARRFVRDCVPHGLECVRSCTTT